MVDGVSGYKFHPSQHPQAVMTLPISGSAVPNNGKVANQVLCPHSQCFGSYFDVIFLAPPAEWQRSFSNAELSVVVNFSLEIFISQKLLDNLCSSLAWSFIRKVPMYWSERSNLAYFPFGGNFLKNCLITFSLFCHEASQGGC